MSQQHQSSKNVLDRRTLAGDHRRLAELLRPGQSVLDVGCGTGSITAGIAEAVQPGGEVLGLDRDADLLARAAAHGYTEAAVGDDPLRMIVRRNSMAGYPQAYLLDPDRNIVEVNGAR